MKYLLTLWKFFLRLFKKPETHTKTKGEILKQVKRAQKKQSYSNAEKRLLYFDKIGYSQKKAYEKAPAIQDNTPNIIEHCLHSEKHIYTIARKIRQLREKGVKLPWARNKYGMQFPEIIR